MCLVSRATRGFFDFLNEVGNKVLADVFLDIESVKPYFRRDKDGVIKASSLFYNTCYSNIYNLWLLCHACNREKSASEQLAFFAEADNFGAPFISAVSAAGGLHRGLFFDRIYRLTGGEINEVVGSDLVTFPTDESQGLVEFSLNWFFENDGRTGADDTPVV